MARGVAVEVASGLSGLDAVDQPALEAAFCRHDYSDHGRPLHRTGPQRLLRDAVRGLPNQKN